MTFMIETPRASVGAIAVTGDWDTVWLADEAMADWSIAALDGRPDSGALQCRAGLASEVIRALFTDERAPVGYRPDERDRRGWWGDGVGDPPIGGRLWTVIENGTARESDARAAEREARRALEYLTTEKVAARVDVEAGAIPARNALWLAVRLYGRDGALIFDRRFEYLWRQTPTDMVRRPPQPLRLAVDGDGAVLMADDTHAISWGGA